MNEIVPEGDVWLIKKGVDGELLIFAIITVLTWEKEFICLNLSDCCSMQDEQIVYWKYSN